METTAVPSADTVLYSFDDEVHNELLHCLQQHNQRLRFDSPTGGVKSPVVFTDVWISDLALAKMMAHAESGGKIEVMGLLLGKAVPVQSTDVTSLHGAPAGTVTYESTSISLVREDSLEGSREGKKGYFVVTDCFALPVEGTETRVNAAEEANEFMIEFLEAAEQVPTPQKVVGWYHSHPNYGCWLSGIDVRTQQLQQQHQDPFLAIVVDPIRTLSNGCIELGAFRTFLPGEEKRADGEEATASQWLPAEKVHDFGVHWQHYYQLRTHFCSNSVSVRLLEGLGNASWPEILVGHRTRRNRPLELRRLEAVVEACISAVSAAQSSQLASSGDSGGHGMREDYDTLDPMIPANSSEEVEIAQAKPLRQRLAGTADQAGEIAVRALTSLVEAAAISAVYHDSTTWCQHLQSVGQEGDPQQPVS